MIHVICISISDLSILGSPARSVFQTIIKLHADSTNNKHRKQSTQREEKDLHLATGVVVGSLVSPTTSPTWVLSFWQPAAT